MHAPVLRLLAALTLGASLLPDLVGCAAPASGTARMIQRWLSSSIRI